MGNKLKMAEVDAILRLWRLGWSQRGIARELGVHRETVARHIALGEAEAEAAKAPAAPSPPTQAPTGSESSKPAKAPAGSGRCRSDCNPFRDTILAKLELDLSAQRIYQDLVDDHGFCGSYYSVRRFVRSLRERHRLPARRMECAPGQEAQVDFGRGAPVVLPDGRRRRTWVLRVVLCHSRKAYSEAVHRQTTEAFLRCLEDAFWHFGGVPATFRTDNLKAAVTKADWYDPELNPKIRSFCEHYGTTILPIKPGTPRHNGKVERGVGYVKGHGLKGRSFESLEAENRHLLDWETRIADTRIHGTTKHQVRRVFEEVERPALQPLPAERFPFFHEQKRKVHRDAHVEVDKSYYSVPPEYEGHEVWARWDSRIVRVFDQRMDQIAIHVKREIGQFSTHPQHIAAEKISRVERGAEWLLTKARRIGPRTARWAEAMLDARGIEGIRVLVGLLSLAKRHRDHEIERACETAFTHAAFRLRVIRELIKRQAPKQETFEFIDKHPIIRDLSVYEELVHVTF